MKPRNAFLRGMIATFATCVVWLESRAVTPLLVFRRQLLLRLLEREGWRERIAWAVARHGGALAALLRALKGRNAGPHAGPSPLAELLASPDLPALLSGDEAAAANVERAMALQAVAAYLGRHAGGRVFILGNGPSVRLEDLERLAGEVTFAANRFHLAYDSLRFRPTYTCSVDLNMLAGHGESMAASCGTPYFIPHAFWKHGPPWTRRGNVVPFMQQDFYEDPAVFRPDPLTGLGNGDSVIYTALQLAVWMGATRLVLYGIDHSLVLPKDYAGDDQPVRDGGERNHFLANYREPGEQWWPPRQENIDGAFAAARRFADANGLEIVNCTRGGKLEAFERQDFDEEVGG